MEKIIIIIFGLVIGSFLNVVIHRLPREKSIVFPGSHCPSCDKPIHFYDNIPVISYIILRGRCRYCKASIPVRYPLVEIFTAFSFWLVYYFYYPQMIVYGIFTIIFLCLLIALALIDLEHQILPDELTIGGAVVFLVYAFFNPMITPFNAIATALGSALVFAGIYFFYLKVRKIEGLGQGDIKMMLLLGLFLGVDRLVIAVMLGSFAGLLVGIFLIIFKGKNLQLKLPFGTFLGLGAYISHFWGTAILSAIRSLYMP
ncbi:MAG: prepilin peptidase [Acidobacteria bacterium]|jgi:leader peptidase (prepilin peptidase)/N-methyltransferase|nr:prepilin peptidase [Acidobacteriota bacterium]